MDLLEKAYYGISGQTIEEIMDKGEDMDEPETVYEQNGYADRQDYLDSLAEDYGDAVYALASMLGPEEDFDGLVVALEDM